MPKLLQLSGLSTTVLGLKAGAKYNVSVSASSSKGRGPESSRELWTEVGTPLAPPPPQLIAHDGHAHQGEIHIRFSPLTRNPNGPVTSYRVVVINETEPAPFDQTRLGTFEQAQQQGLKYW